MLFDGWKILYSPGRLWSASDRDIIVSACMILHNMIKVRKGAFSGDGFGSVRVTDAEIEGIIASESGASVDPLGGDQSGEHGCFTPALRIELSRKHGR